MSPSFPSANEKLFHILPAQSASQFVIPPTAKPVGQRASQSKTLISSAHESAPAATSQHVDCHGLAIPLFALRFPNASARQAEIRAFMFRPFLLGEREQAGVQAPGNKRRESAARQVPWFGECHLQTLARLPAMIWPHPCRFSSLSPKFCPLQCIRPDLETSSDNRHPLPRTTG